MAVGVKVSLRWPRHFKLFTHNLGKGLGTVLGRWKAFSLLTVPAYVARDGFGGGVEAGGADGAVSVGGLVLLSRR